MLRRPAVALVAVLAPIAVLLLPSGTASAYTPRVEVDSGAITTPHCGDNGELMSRNPGGTGTVMFFPAYACKTTFSTNDLRYAPTAIHYTMSGFTGTKCGQFWWGGAIDGESEDVCATAGTPIVAAVTAEQRYLGSYYIIWVPDNDHWINAEADFVDNVLSDNVVEAETGQLNNSACTYPSMSTTYDGGAEGVYYPTTGCSETYDQAGRYELDSVRYFIKASWTGCGYFLVSGSIVGRSATVCSDSRVWTQSAFATTNVGTGSYTIAWRSTDGNSSTSVFVDQHTRHRVDAVEAESGSFTTSSCGGEAPYLAPDVAVFTGSNCQEQLSGPTSTVVDSVTAEVTGSGVCGAFTFAGGLSGTTDQVCLTAGHPVSVPAHTSGSGSFTMTWTAAAGSSTTADVLVDELTVVPSRQEAEAGTPVSTTCGGGTTTGPTADGSAMFLAGSGCAEQLTSAGGVHLASARIKLSGLPSNVCGYLTFSGAVTGRTDTRCVDLVAGPDSYATVPATTTGAAVGGSYTATWVTTTGTLPTTGVTIDSLTLAS